MSAVDTKARPKRSYRVEMSCRYTVEVDANNEDEAVEKATAEASWDADFDVDDVVLTRGEPDPPPPPPTPDVEWVQEPLRSHILESAALGWDLGLVRVWCALVQGKPWATNGHWALRLPEETPIPADSKDASALDEQVRIATDSVPRAAEPHTEGDCKVYAFDGRWPLNATYVDLLEKATCSTAWTRCPDGGSSAAVLRDSSGAAVALLMPRRPL